MAWGSHGGERGFHPSHCSYSAPTPAPWKWIRSYKPYPTAITQYTTEISGKERTGLEGKSRVEACTGFAHVYIRILPTKIEVRKKPEASMDQADVQGPELGRAGEKDLVRGNCCDSEKRLRTVSNPGVRFLSQAGDFGSGMQRA
jgi:hypothetical protein